jgi:hypothetical protein
MKVDLHGINHNEAVDKVEEIMLLNSAKGSVELTVITGNSPAVQAKIINQVCDKHGFVYYKPPHNAGELVIQYEKI